MRNGDGGVFRIAVLASGTGTNLQAILDRLHGSDGFEVVAVGSDRPDAPALERARQAGVEIGVFEIAGYPDRPARDDAMGDWLSARQPNLIVLAGYMQLLSPGFVERFRTRIINVHPALLPSFPGLDAIGQALEHGVWITGVTIHFVDDGVDSGPILMQRPVEIPSTRDRDELEAEIHRVEHDLLCEAIRRLAGGQAGIDPGSARVVVSSSPAELPGER